MVAWHDKYYFDDGNVVFQVGQKLYKIHKRMLIGSESSVFATMFSLPQRQNIEGQIDEKPIILEGEDPKQFEALMRIIYRPLLEDVLVIPIATYTQAMRIAVKYSMDDVLVAIPKVIQMPQQPRQDLRGEILRLAFVAEFPSYFSKDLAIRMFIQACSIRLHPTANDLGPLMAHPAFVALLMQYREGLANQDRAIWQGSSSTARRRVIPRLVTAEMWLDEQFEAFAFKATG